ncbi:MAG: hypothetical protein QNJ46_29625 [Leptolyngbyaceae cyanobacterium MO_188.B28]|nr:hypothetical protein [Leptolyngbyaceae cyanobacterium MO_188.B28]
MSTSNDSQRIQFAFNAYLDSAIGVTINYLIKNSHFPSRTGKHKGLDAMMAFWKPFAYQEQGDFSEEELRAIAIESVEILTRQVRAICAAFELEIPQATGSVTLKQEIRDTIRDSFQALLTKSEGLTPIREDSATAPNRDRAELEGMDFEDDSLFGNLLEDAAISA